jgi:hypothetical protein
MRENIFNAEGDNDTGPMVTYEYRKLHVVFADGTTSRWESPEEVMIMGSILTVITKVENVRRHEIFNLDVVDSITFDEVETVVDELAHEELGVE